jgi:hypothetical protein
VADPGNVVWRPGRSRFRRGKGAIVALDPAPPPGSVVIGLDELGPERAKRCPGSRVVPGPDRATPDADYGGRGTGYGCGACVPATGTAFTIPEAGRRTANGVDFLAQVAGWLGDQEAQLDAILAKLRTHRALDVRLWAVAHPRCEVVCQPTDAASLNLIAPWWKLLRSLALKGRRLATWAAVAAATASWHTHRHPLLWGRRPRRRRAHPSGSGCLPLAA